MLVLKFQIEPGIFEEATINTENVAKWINTHDMEERLIIFNGISLDTDKKKEMLEVLSSLSDKLLSSDIGEKDLFKLMAHFDYYAKIIRKIINAAE